MNIKTGLILATALQVLVLLGMVAKAALPLWTGTEIRLITQPIDPRSLFRGNYARLGYSISNVASFHFPELENLRHGEPVYVSLRVGEDGLHRMRSASLTPPPDGAFIRGRLQIPYGALGQDSFPVLYGIEAWFAPKDKAIALEQQLRNSGAIAVLKVSSGGAARLQAIEERPQPAAQPSTDSTVETPSD